ncbi:FAD-dependent oxidoreductase [Halomonas sp. TBZ9]|uniref:FAD-dependent oxidoreductase n=1 Tax=Vreelandella azerica TaxID=2732867 RepID=A0A7Y3XA34_9GAMM|nr:FAD-dependent oxidoreductase [Halomonas azerica]NOG30765.1 FAD-dependent oxidoreductase [Halomonas azerica]
MTQLLLIGAGHAHAFVLEAFAETPDPEVTITVVSDSSLAAYSGSVPAWLAGDCSLRDTQIDVAALCQQAGATLIESPVVTLDHQARQVSLANGQILTFDVASINVGSTLELPATHGDGLPYLLAMRPLSSLHQRWQALQDRIQTLPGGSTQQIISVGGGAASCETLMSVLAQLRHYRSDINWQGHLLSAAPTLLGEAGWLPRQLTRRALQRAGIQIHTERRGTALVKGGVEDDQGQTLPADIVLWATGAVGHPWLADTSLPLDNKRFIPSERTLAVAGAPGLFAAGDCAELTPPLPKAGVYAVRQGPVLANNLRAACHGQALADWQPPKRVLALIGTGHSHAIASYGPIGFAGHWVWEWKKRIDARFIARFNPPFKG